MNRFAHFRLPAAYFPKYKLDFSVADVCTVWEDNAMKFRVLAEFISKQESLGHSACLQGSRVRTDKTWPMSIISSIWHVITAARAT